MLKDYFNPILDRDILGLQQDGTVSRQIKINTGFLPDMEDAQVAIIGIGSNANLIRKHFYQLSDNIGPARMVDLGNFKEGEDHNNTGYGLCHIIEELKRSGIIAIVLGDTVDYSYYQFMAYENEDEHMCEVVRIENGINLEEGSPLRNIILHKPNYLFNVTNIGVQTHYVSNVLETYMNEMCFDVMRLGTYRDNPQECEPIFRSAEMVSFDLRSVKGVELNWAHQFPNGFTSEEACQISRYAGISNYVSSVLFYGINLDDKNQAGAALYAQLVWYFIQGYVNRRYDTPDKDSKNFTIYNTPIVNGKYNLIFLKSHFSDRWWLEIGEDGNKNYISCSHSDYVLACKDELPDRWWKAYQKLM